MASDLPDRKGWMNGVLASAPACPPFPDFTDFERKALRVIAVHGNEGLLQQVDAGDVVHRINTIHGFYTRVAVDRARCQPLSADRLGGHFEVEGIENGLGMILWFHAGYLETIEGFGFGTDVLEGKELSELSFISGELN